MLCDDEETIGNLLKFIGQITHFRGKNITNLKYPKIPSECKHICNCSLFSFFSCSRLVTTQLLSYFTLCYIVAYSCIVKSYFAGTISYLHQDASGKIHLYGRNLDSIYRKVLFSSAFHYVTPQLLLIQAIKNLKAIYCELVCYMTPAIRGLSHRLKACWDVLPSIFFQW